MAVGGARGPRQWRDRGWLSKRGAYRVSSIVGVLIHLVIFTVTSQNTSHTKYNRMHGSLCPKGKICDRQSIVYVMTSLLWTWINDVLRMPKHCLIHILDPSYNCCFNLYVFIINYKSLTFFYFIFYFYDFIKKIKQRNFIFIIFF